MADYFAAAFEVCCRSTVLQPSLLDGCIAGGLFGSCMADCCTVVGSRGGGSSGGDTGSSSRVDGSGSWEAGGGSLGGGKKAMVVAAKLARAANLGHCSLVAIGV